jgi:GntR family galactonate operon transcriptional repressor
LTRDSGIGDQVAGYPDRGLHGRLVQHIALDIVGGKLPSETILDIDALGAEFDVSRTVVREAVKVLSAKGLVDARPKRGTFVRPRHDWNLLDPDVLRWQFEGPDGPTLEMLRKLTQLRLVIEPAGAGLAAAHRTGADIDAIETALTQMEIATDSIDSITAADTQFHRAVLRASGNDLLAEMGSIIEIGLQSRNRFVHRHNVPLGPSLSSHAAVLSAVRDKDTGRAESTMRAVIHMGAEDADNLRPASGQKPNRRR